MITCPDCGIGLPDDTRRCPMCQRLVNVSGMARRAGLLLLLVLPFAIVIGIALKSQSLEKKALYRQTSSSDAYRAVMAYLKTTPSLSSAVAFTPEKESRIERWGPVRFRVAGVADLQPASGPRVHEPYSCVLHYAGGNHWEVEDLRVERMQ